MNTQETLDWNRWLDDRGEHPTSVDRLRDSADEWSSVACLIDATPLAVVDAVGNDAGAFLQAQFCNDLTALPDGRAQLSGYCTPKGRLLALFVIHAIDGGYRMLMPASVAEAFVRRLSMFVLRAKVEVRQRHDLAIVGLAGSSVNCATTGTVELPDDVWSVSTTAGPGETTAQVVRWPGSIGGQARYSLTGDPQRVRAIWSNWHPESVVCAYDTWQLADIEAGLPRIDSANAEAFVPQMLNLVALDGLSFRKGCYPGQEIVARMQYLGKLKRHMQRFGLPAASRDAAVAGAVLASGADADAGRIVDAVFTGGAIELLAVVKRDIPAASLSLAGTPLAPRDLPYPLTDPIVSQAT